MKLKSVTHLLSDLVSIPSVNPIGSSDPLVMGEARVAAYLKDFLRRLKLDVEFQMVEPNRPNVIATFAPRGAKRSVLLGPHTDTVAVANMTIDPFGAKIRGGKLYGRGACDTKGPMAAMLWALNNFVTSPAAKDCRTEIIFVGLMGEEAGNDGARALMKSGFKASFGIAAEPTGMNIVHTHKGALWFKIITHGKTAHGSMPHKGENAIYKMAHVVDVVRTLKPLKALKEEEKLLGKPTVNVGKIHGGQQINIVPDRCEIDVDRRTLPSESHPRILADIRQALAKRGLKAETKIVRDCRPLWTDPANPFIETLLRSSRAYAPDARLVGAPWFCDAAIFAEHGVPSVAFGPGSVAKAHTADEFIELDQLRLGAEVFLDFLRKL